MGNLIENEAGDIVNSAAEAFCQGGIIYFDGIYKLYRAQQRQNI